METSMKYRTQGSLPIGSQRYTEYIPRTPEPRHNNASKLKDSAPTQERPLENRQPPPPVPPKPKGHPVPAPAPPTSNKIKMSPFDPCKAIIETSPYYIYFKIITENDTNKPPEEDIREILHKLVVVDKDMPKTAKYRNFKSYVQ
ncbi:uncharacterized protein ACMZJ9_009148 isoform 2-T2 [Mantella aurantiaca]